MREWFVRSWQTGAGVWEKAGGGVKRFPSYGLLTCGRIASPASGVALMLG